MARKAASVVRPLTGGVLALAAMSAMAATPCENRLDDLRDHGVVVPRPITAEQVERLNVVVVQEGGKTRIAPFGDDYEKWRAFKAKLRMGDRFVALQASADLARRMGVRTDGHTIVRSNCVVGFLKSKTS